MTATYVVGDDCNHNPLVHAYVLAHLLQVLEVVMVARTGLLDEVLAMDHSYV